MLPEARRETSALPSGRPTAVPAGRPLPLFVVATLVLALGFGLGWMGRWTDAGAFRGSAEFARLGGPWLVGAYVAGAISGWRRGPYGGLLVAALGGAVAISLGSLTYYALLAWLDPGEVRRAVKLGVGWASAGVVIGGAVGALGGLLSARTPPGARPWLQGASVGTLGGLLAGEAIALLWVWNSTSLRTIALLEGLAGAGLVVIAAVGRPWRWALAALLAAALTVAVAPITATLVRETRRTIGWAGA